jgi:DNA-binding NtrC family response regulator
VADHDATLKRLPRFAEPSSAPPAFVLTVHEGPDRGQQYRIEPSHPGPILMGTSPACNFRLSDRSVSRRHVALEVDGTRLRVRDLQSTNGTRIEDVSIVEGMLSAGQRLAIGGTIMHIEAHAASQAPLSQAMRFGRVLGESAEMRKLFPLFERLAESQFPVVIEGETGTGKELLAESLHELGARADGPFVVFDCAAVPDDLVEVELFGDARAGHAGVFQRAHGGTLLIDEIGDVDLATQPKLSRIIERSEIRPLGGEPMRVDVRILVSTHRDLDRDVEEGRFREDLFHRLAVARVELPPLSRRHGDVTVLARAFAAELGRAGALSDQLLSRWESYAWPGNVRELKNAVTRQIALGDVLIDDQEPLASPSDDFLDAVLVEALPLTTARERVVEEFERRYIARVLHAQGGNVSRAAAASGLAHRYFQALRKKRGVAREQADDDIARK